jgi:uncharacterized protein
VNSNLERVEIVHCFILVLDRGTMLSKKSYEIRDPIHTSILLNNKERQIIDDPFVQRLRGIRQLGFAQYPFPGATHSRFSHSVGVMHLAGLAFDVIFREWSFSSLKRRDELRSSLRMAALLHDIGHGPFSHSAEYAMSSVSLLFPEKKERQATHEDYTIAILLGPLRANIERNFSFEVEHIASLIDCSISAPDSFFVEKGINFRPLLSQLISSNLDVDRLDYLLRDSFFTGVRYGQIDASWLVNHLSMIVSSDNQASLALHRRALYAFDNFLLSRYHMFLMVYFHKHSVSFELMFRQYMKSEECSYDISANLQEYLYKDDADLMVHLRTANHHFARLLIESRPYKVAFERHGSVEDVDLQVREAILKEAGIHVLVETSVGNSFSRPKSGQPPIFVLGSDTEDEGVTKLSSFSVALSQSKFEACISRLFVPEESLEEAQRIMRGLRDAEKQPQLLI